MKKILFAGSEVMPFAATGGLGDVLGSLPAAIKAEGGDDVDVRVVMPLHSAVTDYWRSQMEDVAVFNVQLAWRNLYCGVKKLERNGVTYYFIDNEYYFKRDSLYGNYDDAERYAYFCMAIMRMLSELNYFPDVLHANDWQTALSVIYPKTLFVYDERYRNIKTVFTIHNIEYQGQYGFEILSDVFGMGSEYGQLMEYNGCINLIKAAVECANVVSTVSPRYAQEIRSPEFSHGLHHELNNHAGKLCGILNGIDYEYYNPENDVAIVSHFTSNKQEGKYDNKTALQSELGLPVDKNIPMVAIISRLATHKGLDLVADVAYNFVVNNDVQLVVLGKGEAKYEELFLSLQEYFPDKVRALIQYDRDLSKRIYASADIFVMPSKSEPCGLSQMIASRYGAIPVTRETGGLYDSIKGYWEQDGEIMGNGFTFANYYSPELEDRMYAALGLWYNEEKRQKLIKKIMETDFSWKSSAVQYMEMYNRL